MNRVVPPLRMPAEWEPHRATWISWPNHEPDWPGKLDAVQWAYVEIARVLARYEPVEILCASDDAAAEARRRLESQAARLDRIRLHVLPTDRTWLRDSAPTAVHNTQGQVVLLNWAFNGWAKYTNWKLDAGVGPKMAEVTGLSRLEPLRADSFDRLVLEGGGIETNGDGLLLVTEEWLLSDVQVRNPGLTRDGYERLFAEWLGTRRTIWLGEGCVGDDTHGHIDDIARFVARDAVVVAVERDPKDENHEKSLDNLLRLERASRDPDIGPLRIVELPFPKAIYAYADRLPASYANFYVANGVVIVPTFNDVNDRFALQALANLFPDRDVIGIHATDLVWGQGTLHCLTQQEPAPKN
jgi:agmatine deiminase